MHLTATLKLKKLKEREAQLKSEIDTLNTTLRGETSKLITDLLDHYDLLTLPQNTLIGALDETLESLTTNPSMHPTFDARGQKVRQKLKQQRSNSRGKRSLKEGNKGDVTDLKGGEDRALTERVMDLKSKILEEPRGRTGGKTSHATHRALALEEDALSLKNAPISGKTPTDIALNSTITLAPDVKNPHKQAPQSHA